MSSSSRTEQGGVATAAPHTPTFVGPEPPPLGPIDAFEKRFTETAERFDMREDRRSEQLRKMRGGRWLELDTEERRRKRLLRLVQHGERIATVAPEVATTVVEGMTLPVTGVTRIGLERIIGNNDLLSVTYLDRGLRVSRAVGRIAIGGGAGPVRGYGTGFMVSPSLLLTNHHVLPDATAAAASRIEFDYQEELNGLVRLPIFVNLDPGRFYMASRELDFALVAVREPPTGLDGIGWCPLIEDEGKVIIGECLSIVQHPGGEPKQLALRENVLVDIVHDFLHYTTDTAPGSSGAPVFNDQWEVVALHHSGVPERDAQGRILTRDGTPWTPRMGEHRIAWKGNEGVRISRIVRHIRAQELASEQRRLVDELLTVAREPAATPAPRAALGLVPHGAQAPGAAALGSQAFGSPAFGSAAFGSAAFGSAAYGSPAPGPIGFVPTGAGGGLPGGGLPGGASGDIPFGGTLRAGAAPPEPLAAETTGSIVTIPVRLHLSIAEPAVAESRLAESRLAGRVEAGPAERPSPAAVAMPQAARESPAGAPARASGRDVHAREAAGLEAETVPAERLEGADVLLYRGSGLISRAIRLFDGSEVSHAALYAGDRRVIEALGSGVDRRELAASVASAEYVVVRRLKAPRPSVEPVRERAEWYWRQQNRYAYEQILLLALVLLARKVSPTPSLASLVRRSVAAATRLLTRLLADGKEPLVCSELVFRAFDEANPGDRAAYRLRLPEKSFEGTAAGRETGRDTGRVHPDALLMWAATSVSPFRHRLPPDRSAAEAIEQAFSVDEAADRREIERLVEQYTRELHGFETAPAEPVDDDDLRIEISRFAARLYAVDLARGRVRGFEERSLTVEDAFRLAESEAFVPLERARMPAAFAHVFDVAADLVTPGDLLASQSLVTLGRLAVSR